MNAGADERPWSLVIGAGGAQAPFLEAWGRAHRIAATDRDPAAPGRAFAECFGAIDASDDHAVLRFLADALDGARLANVISFASTEPQHTAARLAQRLGVPGPPPLLVEVAHSKRRLLEWLGALELAAHGAVYAATREVARARLARASGHWFLVPDRGGSGHGVARLDAGQLDERVLERAFALSGAGGMVLAPEVPGPEYVVTTVVREGRLAFVSVGRSLRLAESIVVPVGQLLGADAAPEPRVLEAVAERVVKECGLAQGILGFEAVLGPNGPVVLDIDLGYAVPVRLARECGGGSIADHLIGARPLVRARDLPSASGLLYAALADDALDEARLRAIGEAEGATFDAAAGGGSRFETPGAVYRRAGAWLARGPDQAQVGARLAAIARAVYGCGLR